MAGFKTHITFSTLSGIAYGGAAFTLYNVPLPTCVLAGGLCSVSGMLPDLDSDAGVPLRESLAFGASVVPMMLLDRLQQYGLANETIVLIGAVVYVLIRFGLARLLKQGTVHRGMFHSLPAAAVVAELAFLLASGDVAIRLFKAGGVLAGYLSHLVLDEIWSFEWIGYRFRVRKSFGTALKMWGRSIGANLVAYAILAVLALLIYHDNTLGGLPIQQCIENFARSAFDSYLR